MIHATGTNEMPQMGGLRKKMPWTAGTMLVGCLAIAGAGIPTLSIGLSGYYSKDAILAQALSFKLANPVYGYFFFIAVLGAAITSFYMFRLWYMTFAGKPRDEHVYHHAHESPRTMVGPLVVLAVFAVVAGWTLTFAGQTFGVTPLLGAGPAAGHGRRHGGRLGGAAGHVIRPSTMQSHAKTIHGPAELWAFSSALAGFLLATVIYGLRKLDRRRRAAADSPAVYRFLIHKWWFDELYAAGVRPPDARRFRMGRSVRQAGHRLAGGRHRRGWWPWCRGWTNGSTASSSTAW